MKKVGFVDYYISEWHANNYPGWFREMNEAAGTDYELAFAWAELDVSPLDGVTTDQWCEKMGAAKCDTLAELCEKSDVIVILAPSNPEKHLPYAKEVLTYGKRTYIDKTFAPNLDEAKEIFRIAEEHNTPFFSTSALRYADELAALKGADNLIISGCGGNFEEYSVHLVEMAVVLLADPVAQVKVECQGKQRICRAKTASGKTATIIYAPGAAYCIEGVTPDGVDTQKLINSDFFKNLMTDILRFFETGVLPFDGAQTLEVMRLRDALLKAQDFDGQWIDA